MIALRPGGTLRTPCQQEFSSPVLRSQKPHLPAGCISHLFPQQSLYKKRHNVPHTKPGHRAVNWSQRNFDCIILISCKVKVVSLCPVWRKAV